MENLAKENWLVYLFFHSCFFSIIIILNFLNLYTYKYTSRSLVIFIKR